VATTGGCSAISRRGLQHRKALADFGFPQDSRDAEAKVARSCEEPLQLALGFHVGVGREFAETVRNYDAPALRGVAALGAEVVDRLAALRPSPGAAEPGPPVPGSSPVRTIIASSNLDGASGNRANANVAEAVANRLEVYAATVIVSQSPELAFFVKTLRASQGPRPLRVRTR
jgi:hypothetical protein